MLEEKLIKELQQTALDTLLYQFFMEKERYAEFYILGIKQELERRKYDFDQMNDELYIKFVVQDFPEGWRAEVYNLFDELKAHGWTREIPIHYYESWGAFNIDGFSEPAGKELTDIMATYIRVFKNTCAECGFQFGVEQCFDTHLCQSCMEKYEYDY